MTLELPRLAGGSCASSTSLDACYKSDDDLSGLEVEALEIDDGAEYTIAGGPIDLGAGGLSATVAEGSSDATGDAFEAPIALGVSQTWTVGQQAGQVSGEHGIAVEQGIEGGRHGLAINLERGPVLYLLGDIETGSLAFDGIGSGAEAIVEYEGSLDFSGDAPVDVAGALLAGSGPTGPLDVHAAKLFPAPKIEAASVTLEPESEVIFEFDGSRPGVSYSQLAASGPIDLGGAKISVRTGASCYEPKEGTVFTLVTTTGGISGSFGKVDGNEYVPIEVDEAADCFDLPQYLEIACDETGVSETVTGTARVGNLPVPAAENIVTPYETPVQPWVPSVYVEPEAKRLAREAAARQREVEAAEAAERALAKKEARERARECVVPSVKGDSLAKARKSLVRAHCELGAVRRVPARRDDAPVVVVSQGVRVGQRRARDTKVAVKLGVRRPRMRRAGRQRS
ncbi:MAG TPA: hypothetical protein VGF95_12920 [Solirubrobacteraceae bacterium]